MVILEQAFHASRLEFGPRRCYDTFKLPVRSSEPWPTKTMLVSISTATVRERSGRTPGINGAVHEGVAQVIIWLVGLRIACPLMGIRCTNQRFTAAMRATPRE